MIVDRFGRDLLGSDWTTPGRYGDIPGWTPGTQDGEILISEPGIVRTPDTSLGSGAYTAAGEFTDADQWAEITLADALEGTQDYTQYLETYQGYSLFMHAQPIGDASGMYTAFRIYSSIYYYYTPSVYGPIYMDLITVNAAGTIVGTSYVYADSWADWGFTDGELALPAGTKFRMEHVSGSYYAYIFNPKRRVWTHTLTLANSQPAADGYPGFALFGDNTDDDVHNSAVSQFRAGASGDTFLTTNYSLTADNIARANARDLTRSLAGAASGQMLRTGGGIAAGGGGGGASFPAASGWNYGTDGDGATYVLTDGTGGDGGTGLEPMLDVISNTNRRLTGLDFGADGLTMVACSLDGNIATFSLTTAFDPSTATQTGTTHTGHTTCTGVRFNEDGTYVTWLQAVDRFYIMPLATAYVVETTDTPTGNIPKLTLIGYSNSHDPIHAMNQDGTGIWTYGVTAAGIHNFAYMPLSTPYDFTSTGTLVVNTATGHGNIVTTPWGGSLWVQSDGLAVTLHGNGVPELYVTATLNTANDPTDETGDYSWVEDTSLGDMTQTWEQSVFSVDRTIMFTYDTLVPTNFSRWDLL